MWQCGNHGTLQSLYRSGRINNPIIDNDYSYKDGYEDDHYNDYNSDDIDDGDLSNNGLGPNKSLSDHRHFIGIFQFNKIHYILTLQHQ